MEFARCPCHCHMSATRTAKPNAQPRQPRRADAQVLLQASFLYRPELNKVDFSGQRAGDLQKSSVLKTEQTPNWNVCPQASRIVAVSWQSFLHERSGFCVVASNLRLMVERVSVQVLVRCNKESKLEQLAWQPGLFGGVEQLPPYSNNYTPPSPKIVVSILFSIIPI